MSVYYVRSNGSDGQSGLSDVSAWKTISKVNSSTYFAGDYILFKRGETFLGGLNVTASGAANSYITYSCYSASSGLNPIIDASNTFTRCVSVSATAYVIIDGIDLIRSTQYGIAGNPSSNNIIIRNSSLNNHGIDAINIVGGNIAINNCNISNVGQNAINLLGGNSNISYCLISNVSNNAINLTGGSEMVSRCNISGIKQIAVNSSGGSSKITYCTISNASQGINLLNGNGYISFCNISSINQVGIILNNGNNVITNNTIKYTGQSIGSWNAGIFSDGSTHNTDIAYNILEYNGGIGLIEKCHSIFVNGVDVSVHHNTINNSRRGSGIMFKGTGKCYNNKVTSSYFAGIQIGQNDVSSSSVLAYNNILSHNNRGVLCDYHATPNPIYVNLYNNTFYFNDDASRNNNPCEIDISANLTLLNLKNNVVYSADNKYAYYMVLQTNSSINHNLVYSAAGNLIYYNGVSVPWLTWKSYGFDPSGLNSDPVFVLTTDFNLQSSSPCINYGENVGITTDYDGKTRAGHSDITGVFPDIGAYEYSSAIADIILESGDDYLQFELLDGSLYSPTDVTSDANGIYEIPYTIPASTGVDIIVETKTSGMVSEIPRDNLRIFIDTNGRIAIRLDNQVIKIID